jgi:serine/threonine protein kinase
MGEVYRARDTQLKREVAIKVLPAAFSQDPERLARFQREAELLATLNHPNIAAIYGLEDGALVLELVEGPTLADRIAGGPLPFEEALPIARQIADALDAAHEQGVIHRDLKPANIKVRPDGAVKVLDFGLAKALEPAVTSGVVSHLPTITSPAMTRAGVVLGTAAYMSPEQARGRAADKRSDVWAFGCVLYEMLTGRRVFDADEVSDTMAAVLRADPDWTKLGPHVPDRITMLLRRCLEKDLKRRLRDIGDARLELDARSESPAPSPVATADRLRERFAWLAAVGVLALVATAMTAWAIRPTMPPAEVRLEITASPTTDPASLAISPDGKQMVFAGTSQGRIQLWLRPLASVSAQPLPGTEGASLPFWSPDNRSIGFFADRQLKRIDVDSQSVRSLSPVGAFGGGSWSRDGVILFSPNAPLPIFRVPAAGGEAVAITNLGSSSGHSFPQFLPDGHHFLYYVRGSPDIRGVYLGQLDGREARRLFDADSAAEYAPTRHLLFLNQRTLFAHAFDPDRLELTGNPIPVAEQVTIGAQASPALTVSAAGVIAYRTGPSADQRQFVWFDRSGAALGNVGDRGAALLGPSLSPDGRRLALFQGVSGLVDIRLLDIERGVLTRFTSDPADEIWPVWSADGENIVFSSNRNGQLDLYRKATGGTGSEQVLLATPQQKVANDWSKDGRFLLYTNIDPKAVASLWVLPLDGGKPSKIVQTDFNAGWGQFSPDGKWIAYASTDSGRWEIYVQPFPGPGARSPVSTSGGVMTRWSSDGHELFYIAADDRLTAVSIRPASDGQAVAVGTPVSLFATRVGGALQQTDINPPYVVARDGRRFLMSTVVDDANTSPITVILNWKPKP